MKITDTQGARVAVLLGAAILIVGVVALAIVGVVSLASGDKSRPQPSATPAATDVQQVPTETEPSQAPPSETVEPPTGPPRTCLDGAQVANGDTCDLLSNTVMFAVAGVSPDQCTKDSDPPWNAPGQSFTCTLETGEMQVGRFLNASTKAERVAKYRAYHYCAPYDGTWYVCGGSGANQGWLRAYLGDDLLMYMSSKDKGVLLSLDGVPDRDVVRHGQ